jgi:SAM-dependent methyltransferase
MSASRCVSVRSSCSPGRGRRPGVRDPRWRRERARGPDELRVGPFRFATVGDSNRVRRRERRSYTWDGERRPAAFRYVTPGFGGSYGGVRRCPYGEVLEIAVGRGLNLRQYADGVRPTGIEFVPAMLEIARRRAVEMGGSVDLRLGDAQALEFEDATFDTVVCTLSLCMIPDDRAAVADVRRVLRPGGRFVVGVGRSSSSAPRCASLGGRSHRCGVGLAPGLGTGGRTAIEDKPRLTMAMPAASPCPRRAPRRGQASR